MTKQKPDPNQSQKKGKDKPGDSNETEFPQELDQGKDKLVPLKKGITNDSEWIQEVKEKIQKKKES